MPEETSRSEQEESFFGDSYTQHYDGKGKKAGWSEEDETIWGETYTQHYDGEGARSGTDEVKETLWGDTYTQHYDDAGNKIGYSEKKTDFWGNPYVQHYDEQGNEIGQTEEKETFFGDEYEEHKMERPAPTRGASKAKGLYDRLHWSIQVALGLAVIFAVLFVISAILVTLPLWGGMIVVSSIATYVFAEALKKRADWALSLQKEYGARSVWFGPFVALGCALAGFVVMLAAGVAFGAGGVIMLIIFGGLAFWLSKRAALAIMRWRMADAAKS